MKKRYKDMTDEATGVWYISTAEGVTPRLNLDETLYTEGPNHE